MSGLEVAGFALGSLIVVVIAIVVFLRSIIAELINVLFGPWNGDLDFEDIDLGANES